MRAEAGDEVLVVTRWRDRAAFEPWVHSEEFARVPGRGGSEGLLLAHPRMSSYEAAVERDPETRDSVPT